MKPLKERLDEAALAYNEEEIKNEFNTNSLDAFQDGANWMQAEMQKEIDDLISALTFYAARGGTYASEALAKYKGVKDE